MEREEAVARAAALPGWMSEDELGFLYDMAQSVPSDQAIVEIGSYHGRSTLALAAGAVSGHGARVTTIDTFDPGVGDTNHSTGEIIYGDAGKVRASLEAAGLGADVLTGFSHIVGQGWSGPPVGFLFVDGGHEYKQVWADIQAWFPHVADGGVVAFHDYIKPGATGWPGVNQAVDEIAYIPMVMLAPGSIWAGRMPSNDKPQVYWAMLMDRAILEPCINAALSVAVECGRLGHTRISVEYGRTDMARNEIVRAFLSVSRHPEDYLVMLDADHDHPHDIVARLTRHGVQVVGALYRRRGHPYDVMAFRRNGDGVMGSISEWPAGELLEVDAVGTGAIAIKRSVFDRLVAADLRPPFFRYYYRDWTMQAPSEDIAFSAYCEQAGVSMHCDISIDLPHMVNAFV